MTTCEQVGYCRVCKTHYGAIISDKEENRASGIGHDGRIVVFLGNISWLTDQTALLKFQYLLILLLVHTLHSQGDYLELAFHTTLTQDETKDECRSRRYVETIQNIRIYHIQL